MNIIQTFYSYTDGDPLFDNAGFLSAEFNWLSIALSCVLLKQHFGKVTLYCNHKVRILVEELHIPYTNIVEIPDFMENYEGYNLWALPKVYTYSMQREPFLHVDCDWFMFEKLSDDFLSSDLFAQNIEYDDQFYNRKCIERFIHAGGVVPQCVNAELSAPICRVANAGILGGNDIDFIKRYVNQVYSFIKKNDRVLKVTKDGFINSFYEQMFFYTMARQENKSVNYCTRGDKLSTKFDWLDIDFTCKPKYGYMHLLASLKRSINAQIFVSQYLRNIAPDLYKNIIQTYINRGGHTIINYFDICSDLCINNLRTNDLIFSETKKYLKINVPISKESLDSYITKSNYKDDNLLSKIYCIDLMRYNAEKSLVENYQEICSVNDKNITFFWKEDLLKKNKLKLNNQFSFIELSQDIYKYLFPNYHFPFRNPIMAFLKDPLILKVKDVLLRGIGAEIIRYMWTVSEATAPQIISHIQLELKDDDVRSDSELIMKYIISFITNNVLLCDE